MPKANNITGQKFGRLNAIKPTRERLRGRVVWEFVCDCGNTKNLPSTSVIGKTTQSCGCLVKEKAPLNGKKMWTTHGKTKTKEYRCWQEIIRRCYKSNTKFFDCYGGRGITVCARWRESFENFFADMGKKPSLSHSIDRIDVNGNYEPSNCRWASATQQAQNKRISKANSSGVIGVSKKGSKWRAYIFALGKRYHLGTFDTKKSAEIARKIAEAKYFI